jgi:hypothetical protein
MRENLVEWNEIDKHTEFKNERTGKSVSRRAGREELVRAAARTSVAEREVNRLPVRKRKRTEILEEIAGDPSATAAVAAISASPRGERILARTADANLNSMRLVGDIVDTRLDILIDLPGRVQECLLNVL